MIHNLLRSTIEISRDVPLKYIVLLIKKKARPHYLFGDSIKCSTRGLSATMHLLIQKTAMICWKNHIEKLQPVQTNNLLT